MSYMKASALLALIFILSACASTSFYPPWPATNEVVGSKSVNPFKNYSLGVDTVATVGNQMISAWTTSSIVAYYRPTTDEIYPWKNTPLNKRHRWFPAYIYDRAENLYVVVSNYYYDRAIGIIISEDGTAADKPVMRVDRRGSTDRHALVGWSGRLFEKVIEPSEYGNRFRFELVYGGKSGNNINLMYREYNNDFARTAFYQNLTYNLDESSIIKFKDLELKILAATNSDIRFRVISDQNLHWMPYQN